MALTPEDIEKAIKDLGAGILSLKEDLKQAKERKTASPDDIAAIRAELATKTTAYDEALKKLQTAPPITPVKKRGFGFFKFLTEGE